MISALMQKYERGRMRAVHFASRYLNRCEESYSTFEREGAAIIFALNKYRPYILSAPFMVYSDHRALKTAFEESDLMDGWLDG